MTTPKNNRKSVGRSDGGGKYSAVKNKNLDRAIDESEIPDTRTSAEILQEGQQVLEDDYESDETEKATTRLQQTNIFSRWRRNDGQQDEYQYPLDTYRQNKKRRKRGKSGGASLLPKEDETEEEFISRTSSETDLGAWKEANRTKRRSKRKVFCCRFLLHIAIIVFFLVMVFGAYKATLASNSRRKPTKLMSNGTSLWAPTTLVISLDGFRADFLERGLSPTLNGFIKEGVSPLYMLPPFPSVTFVSHYTMSTGLYPESHGIVGNTFWDPAWQEEFYYTNTETSMQPKWWGGEPFWVSAETQGLKTAIHMWPGSEAHIKNVELDFVDKFNGKEVLHNKADRVLSWLDLPGPEDEDSIEASPRPQLLVAYVPDVDASGHQFGPNSTETNNAIKIADSMLTEMFDGIKARNLTDIVNVIVVSDHGMATTSVDRVIQLDDLIDVNKIEHMDGWPLYGLRPKNDADIEPLYHDLKAKAKTNPYFKVYLRDLDMPEEYHFSNNNRIAPLWIVPETGWTIARKVDFDLAKAKAEGLTYNPKGLHGYDYRVRIDARDAFAPD
jgi:predicted AlkP superfamily pyrophosphatase or phosphodiesterase